MNAARMSGYRTPPMDDMLDELQITAERVERFRAIHEEAVRDLRQKIADARAEGHDLHEIDDRIQEARDGVRRFARMRRAADFLDVPERAGGPEHRGGDSAELATANGPRNGTAPA